MKVIPMTKPEHYDFSAPVIDLTTGRPHQRIIHVDVTVEDVIVSALMIADANNMCPSNERETRMLLAEKIKSGDRIEEGVKLSHEEIALIRKAVALSTPTQFYGWVMRALEPKS